MSAIFYEMYMKVEFYKPSGPLLPELIAVYVVFSSRSSCIPSISK